MDYKSISYLKHYSRIFCNLAFYLHNWICNHHRIWLWLGLGQSAQTQYKKGKPSENPFAGTESLAVTHFNMGWACNSDKRKHKTTINVILTERFINNFMLFNPSNLSVTPAICRILTFSYHCLRNWHQSINPALSPPFASPFVVRMWELPKAQRIRSHYNSQRIIDSSQTIPDSKFIFFGRW